MKKFWLARCLVMVAVICAAVCAEGQKQFTLEDLNFGGKNYKQMTPQNCTLVWWGEKLVHTTDSIHYVVDVRTGKEKPLLTLAQINDALGAAYTLTSLRGVSYPYADSSMVVVNTAKRRLLVDFRRGEMVWSQQLTSGRKAEAWHVGSRADAYVSTDDNLYVRDGEGQVKRLTADGSHHIVYGQTVHRSEFHINGGLFWNKDGSKLAFYRSDQSRIADYPLISVPAPTEIPARQATVDSTKYPMAGQAIDLVSIGVYDLRTDRIIYLHTGDSTERYYCGISWSPDGSRIYVQEMNRAQNDVRLIAYDATSGKAIEELYHESDEKYVEPGEPLQFLPWDPSRFVMQSSRSGYNHLYLYHLPTKSITALTQGEWEVTRFVGFNSKAHTAIYESTEAHPLQINIYGVDIATGKRTRMDATCQGVHYGLLSESGAWMVDWNQAPDVPRLIDIVKTGSGTAQRYFTAPNPWEGYAVPTYKQGSIKAADGKTDLFYRMVLPPDFDATKRYPTVVYVYGGPHTRNVEAGWHWSSRSWETYMAQRGYVLFILDNRGSSRRGREFAQANFRQLGKTEIADQMEGVAFLRTQPYVDTTRLGVHGWSFGGFMTISLMTRYPDVFKVGVAGGPVIDWRMYEVMYTERYMSTPALNPEGYERASLIPQAKNLKGRLQIIHGLNDPVVVPQQSYAFLKACIAAGTQPDFYVYPGEPHNMRGHQSVHLHERITRYFDDYLK